MFIHLLLLCALLYMLFVWKKRKFSHLPSPPFMIPWLGHVPLMFDGGDPINHMANLYKKYGRNGILYTHIVGKIFKLQVKYVFVQSTEMEDSFSAHIYNYDIVR